MQTARSYTRPAPRTSAPIDAADLEQLLTGRYVRVRQYIPGFYPRDSHYRLWAKDEEEGATLQIHYGRLGLPRPATPVDTRGDLADFVDYFKGADKLICVVEALETGELIGFLWLEDMIPRHRATVNLFFTKAARGKMAYEAAGIFRDYATRFLGFRYLWGLTPWKHSAAMGKWLGMKVVAVLPSFQLIDGDLKDVYVLRYAPHG